MTECNHCGYEWTYSGELPQATCPACARKTAVGESDDETSEGEEEVADA